MYDYSDHVRKEKEDRQKTVYLSAEFLIAGEFLRRDWPASLRIDSSGKLSVLLNDRHIQFRVACDDSFPIEGLPHGLTVFVNLPRSMSSPPEYFFMTSEEISEATHERRLPYSSGFLRREKSPIKQFLPARELLLSEAQRYAKRWDKIASEYKLPRKDWDAPREGKPDPRDGQTS